MYQGSNRKDTRKSMKTTKKSVTLLVSFLMLMFVMVGGTVAFLVDETDSLPNVFTPSKVTTEVVEKLEGQTKSNVKIKNTGDTEAYIRAAVVVTWKDENGNVYGQRPVAGTDYEIVWNLEGTEQDDTSKWKHANDGFYYWTEPVKSEKEDESNCYTGVLIDSCKPLKAAPDSKYFLSVEIIGSGIQSKPTDVVAKEWHSDGKGVYWVASDGILQFEAKSSSTN